MIKSFDISRLSESNKYINDILFMVEKLTKKVFTLDEYKKRFKGSRVLLYIINNEAVSMFRYFKYKYNSESIDNKSYIKHTKIPYDAIYDNEGKVPSFFRISSVYTKENHRKRGYAFELFSHLLSKFKKKSFCLDVEQKNINAQSLYHKLGFISIGEFDYNKDNKALEMIKHNYR